MKIAWEFGPMDHELEQAVNRRLANHWFIMAHEIVWSEDTPGTIREVPNAVFIFGDEPTGPDSWWISLPNTRLPSPRNALLERVDILPVTFNRHPNTSNPSSRRLQPFIPA